MLPSHTSQEASDRPDAQRDMIAGLHPYKGEEPTWRVGEFMVMIGRNVMISYRRDWPGCVSGWIEESKVDDCEKVLVFAFWRLWIMCNRAGCIGRSERHFSNA